MMQHHNSIEQIASEFAVKFRLRLLAYGQTYLAEVHTLRLIDPFEAINERASLNCHAAILTDRKDHACPQQRVL